MIATNGIHPPTDLTEEVRQLANQLANNEELLIERIAELELAIEDQGWNRLFALSDQEFSRQGLTDICRMARLMSIKNPLILRGLAVKRFYVWGQGINSRAKDEDINAVLQEFINDPKNQVELTGHQAHMLKEIDLECDGNVVYVLFTTKTGDNAGRVHVRTFNFDEIVDVISDPEDSKSPWYYKRVWNERTYNPDTDSYDSEQRTDFYPDWGYNPVTKPESFKAGPIHWDSPVYHTKIGGFSSWKFGLSEFYAALDWATAYKGFLENLATLYKALSRFAWQLTTPGGKAGIATAKARLSTQLPNSAANPASTTASTFIASESGAKMEPMRTSGATANADEGRRIAHMAMMVFGLPETFYADASVGTLATAKSLDRPTELMMTDRQTFWRDVMLNIYRFVLVQAVGFGKLKGKGKVKTVDDGADRIPTVIWNDDVDPSLDVDFPPLVSDDITGEINAIVAAATLNGGTLAGTIKGSTLVNLLHQSLRVPNADEAVEGLTDDDGNLLRPPASSPPPADPAAVAVAPQVAAAEARFAEALTKLDSYLTQKLREAI